MAPPVEISIPSTSVASPSDSKPYTQYNITLRLPLRTYVVQKRYSDFQHLHQALVEAVGAPPPAPLPGKHWFKSTVSSPELTEDRRRTLETYLRQIAESPDRRWRDTPIWRSFLNLPAIGGGSAASSSGIGIESRVPAINSTAGNAAATLDPTTWMDLHREMKGQLSEARQQLAKRDAADSAAGGYSSGAGKHVSTASAEAGAAAKKALIRASNILTALETGLKGMIETKKLGDGELRRRKDLVAAAKAERDGLERLSTSMASSRGAAASAAGGSISREGTPTSAAKAALLARSGAGSTSRRVLGAPLPETERTRELDNTGVLQLQKQQMEEQDQDVADLTKIVRRQKEMAHVIHQEVEEQNEMLEDMNNNVDRVSAKVNIAKGKVRKLGR